MYTPNHRKVFVSDPYSILKSTVLLACLSLITFPISLLRLFYPDHLTNLNTFFQSIIVFISALFSPINRPHFLSIADDPSCSVCFNPNILRFQPIPAEYWQDLSFFINLSILSPLCYYLDSYKSLWTSQSLLVCFTWWFNPY